MSIIIDVRTKEEFEDGHIDEAINIDIYDRNFPALIGALEKDKEYLVYCASGSRSALACNLMRKMGFEHVKNLEGGYFGYITNKESGVV